MKNDVVQARQLQELPLSERFSTIFRDCSMLTRSTNLVVSSFCDITSPRESQRTCVEEQIGPLGPHKRQKRLVLKVMELVTFTS